MHGNSAYLLRYSPIPVLPIIDLPVQMLNSVRCLCCLVAYGNPPLLPFEIAVEASILGQIGVEVFAVWALCAKEDEGIFAESFLIV